MFATDGGAWDDHGAVRVSPQNEFLPFEGDGYTLVGPFENVERRHVNTPGERRTPNNSTSAPLVRQF